MSKSKRFLIISIIGVAALLLVGVAFAAPNAQGVALAPATQTKWATPGKTLGFTVRLTNTGSTTDTFRVAAVSAHGWSVTMPVTEVKNLAAGIGANVAISVTVPSGTAVIGTSDTVVVSALYFTTTVSGSTWVPGATANLVTKVFGGSLYLPLIRK